MTGNFQQQRKLWRNPHISVSGRVSVPVPAEHVVAFLWDLGSLARYEPKVDAVKVRPVTEKTGTYAAQGRFAGLPWGGRFSYALNPHGFHSEMIRGPRGMRVQGGFVVKSEGADVCLITHYERYQFPRWLFPLMLRFGPIFSGQ